MAIKSAENLTYMEPGDWCWGGGSSIYKDWEAGRQESEGEEGAGG